MHDFHRGMVTDHSINNNSFNIPRDE
jgi:hypothetical protein